MTTQARSQRPARRRVAVGPPSPRSPGSQSSIGDLVALRESGADGIRGHRQSLCPSTRSRSRAMSSRVEDRPCCNRASPLLRFDTIRRSVSRRFASSWARGVGLGSDAEHRTRCLNQLPHPVPLSHGDASAHGQRARPQPLASRGCRTDAAAASELNVGSELALEYGADGIWVSNHGGRMENSLRSSVECVPEVAAGVAGRAPTIVDGRFRRGTDIFKALALRDGRGRGAPLLLRPGRVRAARRRDGARHPGPASCGW